MILTLLNIRIFHSDHLFSITFIITVSLYYKKQQQKKNSKSSTSNQILINKTKKKTNPNVFRINYVFNHIIFQVSTEIVTVPSFCYYISTVTQSRFTLSDLKILPFWIYWRFLMASTTSANLLLSYYFSVMKLPWIYFSTEQSSYRALKECWFRIIFSYLCVTPNDIGQRYMHVLEDHLF